MTVRIGLAQCRFPQDGDVLAMVERFASQAADEGCDLVVFPENLMCPRPLEAPELLDLAEGLDGPFVRALGDIARRYGMWLEGTMYEKAGSDADEPPLCADVDVNECLPRTYADVSERPPRPCADVSEPLLRTDADASGRLPRTDADMSGRPSRPCADAGEPLLRTGADAPASRCGHIDPSGTAPDRLRPYNTAVVLDDAGELRGSYRKCHLYDAHGKRESDRMSAGGALARPIQAPFGTLGVNICYDLRFPEGARALAVDGARLIVYPACWWDGPGKAGHWTTLLRARAIENEVFVAGACRAGNDYVGLSAVVDPLGRVLAQAPSCNGVQNEGEVLLTCTIDLDDVARARDAMPILDHRRPDLY